MLDLGQGVTTVGSVAGAVTSTYESLVGGFIKLKWSRFIPQSHVPFGKQIAFLSLPYEEILYGGAAGGGKSDALLMGALQFADDPAYKGILFRRSLTDHDLPGSLMNRAKEWLAPFFDAKLCRWGRNNTIHFTKGGQLTFGYLDKEGSRGKERYQSANFHFIGFDELTHFTKEEYEYLLTRMRRDVKDAHIPLRMRAGTNPGGRGHAWVKRRWQIEEVGEETRVNWDGQPETFKKFRGLNPLLPFIHATVLDNPYLDRKQYERQLDKQDAVTRGRLKHGDWSISEEAIHKQEWFKRRWWKKQEYYILDDGNSLRSFAEDRLFIFQVVDSACSEADGIEGKSFKANYVPSFSCCGTFALTPDCDLLWLDNLHTKSSIPDFCNRIVDAVKKWRPGFVKVESNTVGSAVLQILHAKGITVVPQFSDRDKIQRSLYAQVDAEAGKIWLPDEDKLDVPWLPPLEDELFTWTGKKGEQADQVDVLSSAAQYRSQKAHGRERVEGISRGKSTSMPQAVGGLNAPLRHPLANRRSSGRRRVLFQPMNIVR